ncbi:MAG: tRNA lysidine(34) synthetase TilS [Clostridia bacterium]|nr:tRNA lysidine(34) synthetase TilS [Clostridia bacterium]
MIAKVKRTIQKYEMLQSGDRVILAVSGGPDSVVMAQILYLLKDDLGISLHIAHLNHRFRGKEAEEDARFVERLAQSLNLDYTSGSKNVPDFIDSRGLSAEEGARIVRYQFLNHVAKTVGAEKIALGHNANDQAETVMLHFLRGTGLRGLGGMKPTRGKIIRPLLEIKRREIESYCEENRLEYRIDSTNREFIYRRNKIRHQLLPTLEGYNPRIIHTLNRMAEVVRAESDYLIRDTDKSFKKIVSVKDEGLIEIGVHDFLSAHKALQRRLIRKCFARLTGSRKDLDFGHIERTRLLILKGGTGKRVDLPGNVSVVKSYDQAIFKKRGQKTEPIWYHTKVHIPGATTIFETGRELTAEVIPIEDLGEEYRNASENEAYMDMGKIELPLYARPRCHGDLFRPLGAPGRKKVKDYFIDRKVPLSKRKDSLILLDQKGIIWIAGFCIDDRVKIDDETREVLYIREPAIQPQGNLC